MTERPAATGPKSRKIKVGTKVGAKSWTKSKAGVKSKPKPKVKRAPRGNSKSRAAREHQTMGNEQKRSAKAAAKTKSRRKISLSAKKTPGSAKKPSVKKLSFKKRVAKNLSPKSRLAKTRPAKKRAAPRPGPEKRRTKTSGIKTVGRKISSTKTQTANIRVRKTSRAGKASHKANAKAFSAKSLSPKALRAKAARQKAARRDIGKAKLPRRAGQTEAVQRAARHARGRKAEPAITRVTGRTAVGKPIAGKTTAHKTTGRKMAGRKPAASKPTANTTRAQAARKGGAAASDRKPHAGRGAVRTARAARAHRGRDGNGGASPRATALLTAAGSARHSGLKIKGALAEGYADLLSGPALHFLSELHRRFEPVRQKLLRARAERQKQFDSGVLPDFLVETKDIRDGDWTIAPIPDDLLDRRVEITGPVDRKMIVNALNSGANVYMADFEDATSPTWANLMDGQVNLRDFWAGTIAFTDADSGKSYAVSDPRAVLVVRPRGWHLAEDHVIIKGRPIAGALFDFGLYLFHNARAIIDAYTAPYFYLPKLESHAEARLWNDIFVFSQDYLGISQGTIKATVLIETLPAAFEMDEILFALRDHVAGLNAGRWDYIFSFIKTFANRPDFVLPDRGQVVMGKAFLGAYAALLVKTCHRRGAFAMGGMAAQIPIKGDSEANAQAFAKVRADKEREVREGDDGTWVAHPDLVPVAREVFDRLMPEPNQRGTLREDVHVTRDDLLRVHDGTQTEGGFRLNIRVGVQYLEAWLRGHGAVPLYDLMEDAATAEISRAQIWQWIKYAAVLDTGVPVTADLFERLLVEEMERVRVEIGAETYDAGRFPDAIELFRTVSLADACPDFLTLAAYPLLG
jgi:malate synthase